MAGVKILGTLLLMSTVLCVVNSSKLPSKLIYRKYEKKHPRKNYVQVVEIFETRRVPPHFSHNERDLNDFLARDSYSTDMNCTKANKTVEVVTSPATTTLSPIPTTAYHRPTSPTTKAPNLNNLFTIRMTKPTIKPNPRENNNPDYTNILPWKTNVQVTKHPPSTSRPTVMIIKETDVQPTTNRTTKIEPATTAKTLAEDPRTNEEFSDDDEIIYNEEEFDEEPGVYDEGNYPLVSQESFEPQPKIEAEAESDNEDYDENGDDNYAELNAKKRRKRQKRLRLHSLKNRVRTKS